MHLRGDFPKAVQKDDFGLTRRCGALVPCVRDFGLRARGICARYVRRHAAVAAPKIETHLKGLG